MADEITFPQAVSRAAHYLHAAEDEPDLAKSENYVRIAESYTALATLIAEYESAS